MRNFAIALFLAAVLAFIILMAGANALTIAAEAPLDQPQTTNTPLFIMAGIF